jgi:hypothetical protein
MTRTTISLHESVLKKVRIAARRSNTTMGETITELLNAGLQSKSRRIAKKRMPKFSLKTFSMGTPRIPLEDKEAIDAILDRGNT